MTTDKTIPPIISFQDPLPEPMRYSPPADRLISGDCSQTAHNLFESGDGRFNSGIWESEPGKWRVVCPESEFVHLLAGKLIITSDDGSVRTFAAGDAFVSPAGFSGTWEVVERVRKFYAFYE